VTSDDTDCGSKPTHSSALPAPDAMFQRLVECVGQGIGWADLNGNIAYMNPALRRMLELSPEAEVRGLNLRRFRPPEAGPVAAEMLRATLAQGGWSGEIDLLSEQGRVIPTRHDIHLLRDDAGTPIAIACAITDLSQQKQHEQMLERSKAKYRTLVENIPQRVFYKDIQSRYLAANRRYADGLGLAPQDVVGQDDYAFHPRDLADKYRADDQRVMASGQMEEYDEPELRDGKHLTVHTIKTPVRDGNGQVIGICGIFWDVTEQRAAFERVEMLQRVVDFSHQPIGWADLDTTQRYCNAALRRLLAVSEAADVNRYRLDDFYGEAQRQTLHAQLLPELMQQGHWNGELDITALDGRVIPTLHSVFLIRDSGGQPIALANVLTDLSAQKHVEAELRSDRNFSGAVLENAGALILVMDREGRIRRFNRACEMVSGYRFAEAEGRYPWDFLLLPEERDKVREIAFRALAENPEAMVGRFTNAWLDRAGGKHLIEWNNTALRDDQGRMDFMVAIGIDVTEKRAVEAALRRSEETYARAEAITHLGSWSGDIQHGNTHWSDEIYRIFGLEPQAVEATYPAFLDAIHPDDRQRVIDAVNASIANPDLPYSIEHRVLRPNGEVRNVSERGQVYRDEQGKPIRIVGSMHDITEQKNAATLQANDLFKQAILDSVLAQIAVLDRDGVIITVNQAWRRFALENSTELGMPARRTEVGVNYLGVCQTSHGDSAHEARPAYAGIRAVLEGRLPSFGFEYPCHSPDQQRWYSMTVTPLHAEGEGVVITHTDITASKLAQDAIRSARDEAERANRAKSEFLSRMSHELRTPLNAILGFGQLLERANLVALQTDNVREILHAGRHLLELINEVLDLARIESGKFSVSLEAVPLLPLIADCLSLMRPQAESAGIELIETAQDCGEQVRADRTRLKQVLLNLLSNAVKYNRPQGAINVTPTLQEDAVQIRIRDTGAGLTAEQQARLFVPFERLDADQSAIEGTGIGLALSKRLVELMGGSIGVESEPGVGSTFWLTLPLADAAAEASDSVVPASAAPAPQAVAERQFDILCIEDNPANLRLVERILAQRADIRLLSASAPGLGLELAAAHRPSLILLDINLPDMDGYEVLRRLQANPATCSIPVLGISSNAMPKDIERALAAGFSDYLTKPLDIAQFMAVVYSYLEAPS
jgi:PAS domain S-box-containing protein